VFGWIGGSDAHRAEGTQELDSTTEQSAGPASSGPRGRDRVHGPVVPGRAPDPKRPLNLGHQRNVGFVSPTHQTKLTLCVPPPGVGGVRVGKSGFVPSSNTIRIASPQRVSEPGPCPRRGGDTGATR